MLGETHFINSFFTAIEKIIHMYEEAPVWKRYRLTREEYLFLYGTSQGCDNLELMEYFNRQKTFIYEMRQRLIQKFKAKNFHEVIYLFGQFDHKK